MKNEKEFVKKENKLRMENDARLLADLICLNYEYFNDNLIDVNRIYRTLHDTVSYKKDEEEKIKEHAFIYLRVDYGLKLNK